MEGSIHQLFAPRRLQAKGCASCEVVLPAKQVDDSGTVIVTDYTTAETTAAADGKGIDMSL